MDGWFAVSQVLSASFPTLEKLGLAQRALYSSRVAGLHLSRLHYCYGSSWAMKVVLYLYTHGR